MHLKQRVDHQVDFLGIRYFEGIGPPWKSGSSSTNVRNFCTFFPTTDGNENFQKTFLSIAPVLNFTTLIRPDFSSS
ncbi:CNT_HP2_G0055690.mRNA.1.CDS.1 [Saccharomyces cerevisiae]|nr:CNT_HP2_G0055690.mRNA.1.CDS.1 [Saccharomyces cerevisiae]CAI6759564.1 CNT_HP2_G0055690.mRNA.1.CDS.1 [Saccharomyces cerevisiae]